MRLDSTRYSDDCECPECKSLLDVVLTYEDPGTLVDKEIKSCPVCNVLIEIDQYVVTTARLA